MQDISEKSHERLVTFASKKVAKFYEISDIFRIMSNICGVGPYMYHVLNGQTHFNLKSCSVSFSSKNIRNRYSARSKKRL